jgi:glycosyltransferase involved in cell wall biosynthesis
LPAIIGDAGLTFEPGTSADLERQLDTVLADDERAAAMGRRGLGKVIAEHTWDVIGPRVRQVYRPGPPRTLRVLVCSNLFPPDALGGAELVAYETAKRLRDLGHDVHVFTGRLENPDPVRISDDRKSVPGTDFRVTRVPVSSRELTAPLWNFLRADVAPELRRLLDEFRPDVAHVHGVVGLSIEIFDECRRRDIPTVVTLHDYWGICLKSTMVKNDGAECARPGFVCLDCRELVAADAVPSPARNARFAFSLAQADWFLTPSRYVAAKYVVAGFPADRISVLRNGLDLERFAVERAADDRPFTVGFVGYLGKHKGLDVLLRAFARLPEARLVVVGDGEELEPSRRLAAELGIERRVVFRGRVPNEAMPAVYAGLDVLAVPSVWPENAPVTITEAMASGMPVVASAVGGVAELVEEGETGFLVPAGDVDRLASRLDELRRQPALRLRMGGEGRRKIGRQPLARQVDAVVEVYQQLIERHAAGTGAAPAWVEGDVVLVHSAAPWSEPTRELYGQLREVERRRGRRLVVSTVGLAIDDLWRRTAAVLFPEEGNGSLVAALEAFERGVPILVDERCAELSALAVAANAGIVVSGVDELGEALGLLLSDAELARALAANGREFARAAERRSGRERPAVPTGERASSKTDRS